MLDEVIKDLEKEYGGKNKIVDATISKVKGIRKLDHELRGIKTFVIEVTKVQLLSQQCGVDGLAITLLMMLKKLLPTTTNIYWGNYQREIGKPDNGDLDDLVEFVRRLEREANNEDTNRSRDHRPRSNERRGEHSYRERTTDRRREC